MKFIELKNITKNNLKNFSVKIPRQKLVVIVGPSGSGKTTLIEELPKPYEFLEQKVFLPADSKLSLGQYNFAKLKTKLAALKKTDLLIVDEPCAGFCATERVQILKLLKNKVRQGYSIIAVEHTREIIAAADYIIELGPGAGRYGGKLIFAGGLADFKKSKTITAQHVFAKQILPPRTCTKNKTITISKITAGKFKNYSFTFPLNNIVCLTGCSGSGKSTLLDVTYRALFKGQNAWKIRLKTVTIKNKSAVRRSYIVPQAPIGNHPTSTLATYTKIWAHVKKCRGAANLTIDEALEIFKNKSLVVRKLKFLQEVGLGYLVLGQKSGTLSGGEAQRVRIANILAKKLGDRSVYIFDTPTRGLHLKDIPILISVFKKIIAKNNTILIADNREEIFNFCDCGINL